MAEARKIFLLGFSRYVVDKYILALFGISTSLELQKKIFLIAL